MSQSKIVLHANAFIKIHICRTVDVQYKWHILRINYSSIYLFFSLGLKIHVYNLYTCTHIL